jgi:transcriptional regulator with XRE-family HTH domain
MKSDFAGILSSLRREKGLSQRCAAAELGISQALLSHYENNAREPKLEFVVKACDYYGVTADYILGRINGQERQTLLLPRDCDCTPRLVSAICSVFEKLDDLSNPELYATVMDYLVIPAENVAALLLDPFALYNPIRDAEYKIAEAALIAQAQLNRSDS